MPDRVAAVRAFSRFYTELIGVLQAGLHETPYSLTECRVIFELGRYGQMEVGEVRRLLDLDAGYLSRILNRLESDGLVRRERSAVDARRQTVVLTDDGRSTCAMLEERADSQVRDLLAGLAEEDQERLVSAMTLIRGLLQKSSKGAAYVLRPPRAGDLGWVVHRHGVLYSREYGWGPGFEAEVARVAAAYLDHDSARKAGWIAEVDGKRVGCVFCVPRDPETAQLRLLLVEPSARGMGIGRRLVEECLRFAADAGYRRIMLWTRDDLVSARRIYKEAGFTLSEQHEGEESGHKLTEEIWTRDL
ncbi:DNA-binding transcriptional regulator, MarR family [Nonomuraea maritima]|uniref:DNA-binding transcriptional regulator, MarR family n=1 Tax=Nonomuraea maritima TaxID=683260 RepID=A0A1G9JVG3_9ACTN|nr:bifunctional helix-turn-helix transcriptional regulator/GNAT family N-acetyltransferase [Nonomuraea maritima]SDL41144.1 DNA-binding transcriptional regulator, MarR family [Nonomuraea maritima]